MCLPTAQSLLVVTTRVVTNDSALYVYSSINGGQRWIKIWLKENIVLKMRM